MWPTLHFLRKTWLPPKFSTDPPHLFAIVSWDRAATRTLPHNKFVERRYDLVQDSVGGAGCPVACLRPWDLCAKIKNQHVGFVCNGVESGEGAAL